MILSVCDLPEVLKVMRIINIVITIIKIVVPIILMVSAMIDLVRTVTNSELNKITKPMVAKVVAAVLIFLIPTFVGVIADIAGNDGEYEKCLGDITRETIRVAYANQEETLVAKAEETLDESDYNNALYYLNNITPESAREEFKSRLDAVKAKIEEAKKPKVEEPIKPDSSEKIIKQEETKTLKVYITQKGNYYLTRVWMENPYTQINKEDANPYGKTLKRPSELLKNAISSKGLDGKLIVAMNASGFYLKDTFDASSVSRYPAFDKTSVGTLVITDGKVVRNAYEKGDILTWFIAGIDPNNKLLVFEDKKIKETNSQEKKAWSESVINTGIRNTFTFAAPLIENGEKTNWSNRNSRMPGSNDSTKGLQIIGQINNNNFVFYTSKSGTRDEAIKLFLNMGCKTAVNLDGGGSVALLFKPSNSSNIETVTGNGRSLPEVMYITE